MCPASSTADKTVRQVLFFLPVPGFHDNQRSKMSIHASSHRRWSVSAIRITESSTPRKVATAFQSAATSRTMNLLMCSSVGCESMLIGVWESEEVEQEKTASVQYSMQSRLFHNGNLVIAQDLLTSKNGVFCPMLTMYNEIIPLFFLKKSYEAIHHWQHCSRFGACPFLLDPFLQGLGTPIAILQVVFKNCISN